MRELVVLSFAAIEEALLAHVEVEAFQATVPITDRKRLKPECVLKR